MKIKVVSDLHLEFGDVKIPNKESCDVLVLAGDIMIAEDLHRHSDSQKLMEAYFEGNMGCHQESSLRYKKFLAHVSKEFPHVIYIAGNHEFYHGKWFAALDHLREECSKFSNIYFLECDTKKIDDVTFIGATLWSNFHKEDPLCLHAVKDMMNDFHVIRNDYDGFSRLKPIAVLDRHRRSLDYIKSVVAEKHDEKFVVVGHHAPSSLSVHEMYKRNYLMNGAYYSDLSEFILDRPQIKLWIHGHMHNSFDYVLGETRVVCNPRGYTEIENPDWDPNLFVEV